MIVRVKTWGAYYTRGQRTPWDDVYLSYRIGRKTHRLAPCIMGRPDLKAHRAEIRYANKLGYDGLDLFGEELEHAKTALRFFARGDKHYVWPHKHNDRCPNVYVREKMVSRAVVERVARALIRQYDKYDDLYGALKFRYPEQEKKKR